MLLDLRLAPGSQAQANQAAMEKPWLILGRVLRVDVGAGADAEEQAPAMGAAQALAQARLEDRVVTVDEAAARAVPWVPMVENPHFTVSVAPPSRVSILTARGGSHPKPQTPDMFPYIIASGPFGLLAVFADDERSHGTDFNNFLNRKMRGHLVMVRRFRRGAHGRIVAFAHHVRDRSFVVPSLANAESIGFLSDSGDRTYMIAELSLSAGGLDRAVLICYRSVINDWSSKTMSSPLPSNREWKPHGTVSIDTSVLWFDLSWGIITYNLDHYGKAFSSGLDFHHLPPGRALDHDHEVPADDIHTRRCITVSGNLVRYVEIIPNGQASTVSMWYTRRQGRQWAWKMNYEVRFETIWINDGYTRAGLPLNVVPVLVGVSPVNPNEIYFALEQPRRLFGVDLEQRVNGVIMPRVVSCEPYEPVNLPRVSARYLMTWNLDTDREINIGHQVVQRKPAQQADDQQQDRKGKSKVTGSRQESTLPSSRASQSRRCS